MISKEEFKQKCSTIIKQEDVKTFSKKKTVRYYAMFISFVVEALLCAIAGIIINNILALVLLPAFLFVYLITFFLIWGFTLFNFEDYKKSCMNEILPILLEDYKYEFNHEKYLLPEIYKKSPFAAYYSRYHGEDLIEINIPNDDNSPSDVVLHMSDLHLTKTERDSDGHHHTVSVFSGSFGYAEFPFSFKCSLGINRYVKNTQKLKLEDINFNKAFKVFTDNEIETLIILSPNMMKKLEAFKSLVGEFSLAVVDNKLYFHIYKNMFEIKQPNGELNVDIFDNIYDDVCGVLAIVNEIKNNNKIFKM